MPQITAPSEFQGNIIGDVNRRKGIIMGSEQEGDDVVIQVGGWVGGWGWGGGIPGNSVSVAATTAGAFAASAADNPASSLRRSVLPPCCLSAGARAAERDVWLLHRPAQHDAGAVPPQPEPPHAVHPEVHCPPPLPAVGSRRHASSKMWVLPACHGNTCLSTLLLHRCTACRARESSQWSTRRTCPSQVRQPPALAPCERAGSACCSSRPLRLPSPSQPLSLHSSTLPTPNPLRKGW